MLYRQMGKTGDKVSALGYGCMRFPRGNGKAIDEPKARRQLILAAERGVNYFDTAAMYEMGKSEEVLGNALAEGYRNQALIATKMPTPLIKSFKDMVSLLDVQLKRLKTDHIDYYLLHALATKGGWERYKGIGVEEFFLNSKKAGKIRHFGFSYHGNRSDFKEIIDDYSWDFCQIQYNYLDENFQAGKEGLKYAASKGLGVVVMEPLRGGLLVNRIPPEIKAIWEHAPIKRTPAEWALRWVWNHPEVSVVLSGMNEETQVIENIQAAENSFPGSLSPDELSVIDKVREAISKKLKIGCTGCGYCMPCPNGVNISQCFSCYNSRYLFDERSWLSFRKAFSSGTGGATIFSPAMYMMTTGGMEGGAPSYASLCRDCGKCETLCPQHLPIRNNLKMVAKEMEPFYFRPVVSLTKTYYKIFNRSNRKRSSQTE